VALPHAGRALLARATRSRGPRGRRRRRARAARRALLTPNPERGLPMAYQYPVSRPHLTGHELDYVTETVGDGWISSQGRPVRRFEEAFAAYNGSPHGVAWSSGTTARTLALRVLGVGPGDEVIVPEFTMIASAWAVTYTGATPVFVDCGDDLNIDPDLIEEK